MRKIWGYLKAHIRADFEWRTYLTIAIFLAITTGLNYAFDIEDDFLETRKGFMKFFWYFLFYSLVYYFSLAAYTCWQQGNGFWRSRTFWIKSTLAIAALSLDNSVPFLRPLVQEYTHPVAQYWVYKVVVNVISVVTILAPLLIFYKYFEKQTSYRYGLNARHFDTRPYLIMLLIMLPLIIVVSFLPSFINQYPMYKTSSAHVYYNMPEWVMVLGYEAAYGFDFLTVEFLFRGFMVIGMASVLGRKAILAMAATYCFLHFGKPAGEAISSIFGGYILGAIAYETRSIWGGVIVHVGIAWMMETVAFMQKHL